MGHYLYKNNHLFELGDVSHGKLLYNKIYIENNNMRFYKWTILKIEENKNQYNELKNRQLFYNSQLLLNKNKNKIKTTCAIRKQIAFDKKKINANIIKDSSYLIIDPNSNVIMQYNKSANLKHIISDIKRLLQYARF